MQTLVLDTEVYQNYFLLAFLNPETGNVRHLEMFPGQDFARDTARTIMQRYQTVSFNGIRFDIPIISAAINGADCATLKRIANMIIEENLRPWELPVESMKCDHIDVFEVAPGVATSLKIYGGRMHAPKLQDLPIEPNALIDPEQRKLLRTYCVNDLQTTDLLRRSLTKQIELREQMGAATGLELRSKSDAQIAEAVIKSRVEKLMNARLDRPVSLAGQSFRYKAPDFIHYRTESMRRVLGVVHSALFEVNAKGVVEMPPEIESLTIAIGSSLYRMGIGGLHSSEKQVSYRTGDDYVLVDRDVASYYPTIILNCGLRPKSMGHYFTKVYRGIVVQRLEAKRAGNKSKAESLKIVVNGSFGKFGSPWSRLYSPHLLIQTTVTGQLALLMLIEMLEVEGIGVVSANTDGVVIRCPRTKLDLMNEVIAYWEMITDFDTEETRYAAIYSRDVNNYIAVKMDGSVKLKGAYAPAGLMKNPTNTICSEAVVRRLVDGISIEQTIMGCRDIRQFVTVRQVNGGALDQSQNYLGKAVRWYYATGITGPLRYKSNGYTVARSEGARPVMELPQAFPDDVNYEWYINEAKSILSDVGGLK